MYPHVPIIYYTKNNIDSSHKIDNFINCLILNSNVNIKEESKKFKVNFCYQGNLDPLLLVAGGAKMVEEINKILKDMESKFFIFNLGHGILPHTPIDNVYKLIDTVREFNN